MNVISQNMRKAALIRQDPGPPACPPQPVRSRKDCFMMSHTLDVVSLPEQNVVSLAEEKRARIAAETDSILDDTLLVLRRLAEVRAEVGLPLHEILLAVAA